MKLLQVVLLVVVFDYSVGSRLIGAFNIQVFGKTKAGKPDVMDCLVQILERYDMVLIQEIRDIDEVAIVDLLDLLNSKTNNAYDMLLGPRVGRTSSKEQYCYFYRTSVFKIEGFYNYDDDASDEFEREPFNALFEEQGTGKQFIASALHAKPDDAVHELDYMDEVYYDILSKRDGVPILMMGDFNADCSYVKYSDWDNIRIRTDNAYEWLITDDVDTTVSSTHCAYDRLVLRGSLTHGTASVFRFDNYLGLSNDEAKEVSDHYPVEMTVF